MIASRKSEGAPRGRPFVNPDWIFWRLLLFLGGFLRGLLRLLLGCHCSPTTSFLRSRSWRDRRSRHASSNQYYRRSIPCQERRGPVSGASSPPSATPHAHDGHDGGLTTIRTIGSSSGVCGRRCRGFGPCGC